MLIGQDADKNSNILTNTLTRFRRLGYEVPSGNTIEEVAKKAGVPVNNLLATVKEFNAAVKKVSARSLSRLIPMTNPMHWKLGLIT